jgi:hypothetical protein
VPLARHRPEVEQMMVVEARGTIGCIVLHNRIICSL